MSSSEGPIQFEIPIPKDRADQSITESDVEAAFTGDFIKKVADAYSNFGEKVRFQGKKQATPPPPG
jgi:hypothetical protein